MHFYLTENLGCAARCLAKFNNKKKKISMSKSKKHAIKIQKHAKRD